MRRALLRIERQSRIDGSLQAEGAMAEVRLVRVKARRLLCVVTHFFSVLNCQDDKNSPRAHPGPVLG
jgi:hypothetical protein